MGFTRKILGYSSKFLIDPTGKLKIFEGSLCLFVASVYSLSKDFCFFVSEINFTKANILSIFLTKNEICSNVLLLTLF